MLKEQAELKAISIYKKAYQKRYREQNKKKRSEKIYMAKNGHYIQYFSGTLVR